MLDEIRKRPFIRPLFLWITGILLYRCCPSSGLGLAGLGLPFILLSASALLAGPAFSSGLEKRENGVYARRWVWGLLFASLVLSLSLLATAIRTEGICQKRTLPLFPAATAIAPGFPDTSVRPVAAPATEPLIPPSGQKASPSPGPLPTVLLPAVGTGQRLQAALVEKIDRLRLSDEEKSVLATLALGYRQAMNRDTRRRFSVAGVSHILAVSGFHVAVVAGFVTFLLAGLPRRGLAKGIRWLLTLAIVWGYVWLTGAAASAVRAGVMLTLFLTGRLLGRPADRYNTWAAAAFCMLAYNPLYLFDIGFQLSYAAVFSILYFQPRLQRIIEVRNPLLAYPWEGLTLTVAAQAGTLLPCLYYFGRFPLVFLFTNLPVTVLATLLIPLGLLWIGLPAGCPGYDLLQTGVEGLTRGLVGVVDGFGGIPGAAYPLSLGGFGLFCACAALFFGVIYGRQRRAWQLFTALGFVLIMLIGRLIERFLLPGF